MLARLSSYTPTEVYVCLYRNKKAIQSFNQIFQCYWNFSIWGRISFGKKKTDKTALYHFSQRETLDILTSGTLLALVAGA